MNLTDEIVAVILEQVKINIELMNEHEQIDARLIRLIKKAYLQIMAMGAQLNPENIAHQEILVDFVAWQWNTRHEQTNEMPDFIRLEINNVIFSGDSLT